MSKYTDIKTRIVECMKSGESIERDILRTLIGELQAKATKEKITDITDEMVHKTVKSFKENAETCQAINDNESVQKEITIYTNLLPTYDTVEQIVEKLSDKADMLKSAKAIGPATGMAMGILKKTQSNVLGKDVSQAVKLIRGE